MIDIRGYKKQLELIENKLEEVLKIFNKINGTAHNFDDFAIYGNDMLVISESEVITRVDISEINENNEYFFDKFLDEQARQREEELQSQKTQQHYKNETEHETYNRLKKKFEDSAPISASDEYPYFTEKKQ